MAGRKTAVFGMYTTIAQAEGVVDALVREHFSNADVSFLLADGQKPKDFAHHEEHTMAPEGTTIGGTLGLLAGVGALVIPGLGPFIAAGPIIWAFVGLGHGGAVAGLVEPLVGMGIPEYEAKRYERWVTDGGILLSVHCDTADETKRAKAVLNRTGDKDVAPLGEEGVGATAVAHVVNRW